jgi:DNA-binding transcriptional LysR family regulator
MDRFAAIDTFVRVAESRSFAEAARQMRVSRSVVTARIQQLESFVGAPLFHRNTRSVRLSELGQAFLRDCAELVGRTNEVVDQMREVTTSPTGRLRVHALPGFVLGHLARVLQEFQGRWPQIVLDMIVNDAAIDPVKEGFDCALQIFPPRSEELVSKKLFPVRRVFVASPDYLKRHGTPRGPRDLKGHRIGWYSGYPTRERLQFHGPGAVVSLELAPVLLTNSVHLLREYALEHAGIVPDMLVFGKKLQVCGFLSSTRIDGGALATTTLAARSTLPSQRYPFSISRETVASGYLWLGSVSTASCMDGSNGWPTLSKVITPRCSNS